MKNEQKMTVQEYYTQSFLDKYKNDVKGAILELTTEKVKEVSNIKDSSYDVVILPFTLNETLEYEAVIVEAQRILKKNGVLLCMLTTIALVPLSSKVKWGITGVAAKYIFSKYFPPNTFEITNYGNVLTGRFLINEQFINELSERELNYSDPHFPVIVGVKAIKV